MAPTVARPVQDLTVKTAAEYLSVSPLTLRNRNRADKLTTSRPPVDRYHLYHRADFIATLRAVGAEPRGENG